MTLHALLIILWKQEYSLKRKKALRLGDIKQLQIALELSRQDNGAYPTVASWSCFDCANVTYNTRPVTAPVAAASISAALDPYLGGSPADPKLIAGAADSGYLYTGSGTNYCVMAFRTPENMKNFPTQYINPVRCQGVDATTGQCMTTGYTIESIFVGVGTYETAGC